MIKIRPFSSNKRGEIYDHSYKKYFFQSNFFFNEETRMHELFELAGKADFIAASMLQVDFSELSSVDTFKENYPFTVINFLLIFP